MVLHIGTMKNYWYWAINWAFIIEIVNIFFSDFLWLNWIPFAICYIKSKSDTHFIWLLKSNVSFHVQWHENGKYTQKWFALYIPNLFQNLSKKDYYWIRYIYKFASTIQCHLQMKKNVYSIFLVFFFYFSCRSVISDH